MNVNVKIALGFTGGVAVGTGIGILVTRKKAQADVERQVASVKAVLNQNYKQTLFPVAPDNDEELVELSVDEQIKAGVDAADAVIADPDNNDDWRARLINNVGKYNDKISDLDYGKVTLPESVTNPVSEDGFVTVRDPNGPYVIPVDEYMEDNEAFEKLTVTYHEGDDTLIDERESIIPNIDEMIGARNLLLFGQGSKDKNVVYVRNERIGADFEVMLDKRSYVEAVTGYDAKEVENLNKPRRFPRED